MSEQRDSAGQELGFLERLSIEELEALLKTSGSPNDVEAFLDAVIKEVVKREKKEPTGRLPDVDAAWEELQARCKALEETASLSGPEDLLDVTEQRFDVVPPKKKASRKPGRSLLRRAAKIAAIVVLTLLLSFSMMIGVQAFGIDMFGALARWTSDTFHFETQQTEHDSQNDLHDAVQAMLTVQGILGEYAPRWYPEGSEITEYSLQDNEFGLDTHVSFSASGEKRFHIRVREFKNSEDIGSSLSEKTDDYFDEYLSHSNKLFYLFSNEDYVKGIWSDGDTILSIRGNFTVEELKKMIDSIGGQA